jgi:hypothetical protein
MQLDLTDEEAAALTQELHEIIENDRYPFSHRIRTLRSILAKLRPEPIREPLPPPAVAERRTELECGNRRKPCCAPVSPRWPPELPGSSDRVLTYRIKTQINPTAVRVRPGRHHHPLG